MQLLSAIRIKTELCPDTEADLLLSDHSQDSKRVLDNLSGEGVFKRVKLCKTWFFTYEQGKVEDLLDVIRIATGIGNKYKKYLFQIDNEYSKIYYYNLDALLFSAFDMTMRYGNMPECIRLEEGVGGYGLMVQDGLDDGTRLTVSRRIRRIMGKKDVFMETRKAFCFSPEIFPKNDQIKVEAIPQIDRNDTEVIDFFKRIFSYEPREDFTEKILFFGSSADIDGYSIHESDFIIELTKRLGSKSLMLKTHPRDGRDVYKMAGISIMESSNVPWEVMQLTTDFSKHIFITIGSSSLINTASMFEDDVETYMLYPLFRAKDLNYYKLMDNLIRPTLTKLQAIGKCSNIKIIEDKDEWEMVLDKIFK